MKYILSLALVLGGLTSESGFASDRIDKGLDRLKENYENSNYNKKEYGKNLSTVKTNIAEIDKVLTNLGKQKKDIQVHLKNSDKNKLNLKNQKVKLQQFVSQENAKISAEQKRIDLLKKQIKKLEDNQEQRRVNVAAYNDKVKEIDTELADWDRQKQKIAELEGIIVKKQSEAKSERKEWVEKEKSYAYQEKKWSKEEKKHRDLYKKYDRLNN